MCIREDLKGGIVWIDSDKDYCERGKRNMYASIDWDNMEDHDCI